MPVDVKDIKINEFIYFHSDLDLKDTYAICEVVLNIYDKDNSNKPVTNVSMGLLAVKLTDSSGKAPAGVHAELPIYLTTPRVFMQFEDGQAVPDKIKKHKEASYKLAVTVHEIKGQANTSHLFQVIQSNCLVSHQDTIPGLKQTEKNKACKMPQAYHENLLAELHFDRMTEVYVHEIKMDKLNEIEKIFRTWLESQVSGSGYSADIASRKLSVAPSNSCFVNPLASQSFVELQCTESKSSSSSKKQPKQKSYKVEIPRGKLPLKVSNLPINSLTCLVFRVVYKVKYTTKDSDDQ